MVATVSTITKVPDNQGFPSHREDSPVKGDQIKIHDGRVHELLRRRQIVGRECPLQSVRVDVAYGNVGRQARRWVLLNVFEWGPIMSFGSRLFHRFLALVYN